MPPGFDPIATRFRRKYLKIKGLQSGKNLVKFLTMDQKTRLQIETALKTARHLVQSLEAMLPESVEVPPEIAALVADRVAKRICLGCSKPIAPDEKDKRGNHIACYGTLRNRIRKGLATDEQLVAAGKLTAEGRKPGRPAAIDLAAENLAKAIVADEKSTYDPKGKRPRKRRS